MLDRPVARAIGSDLRRADRILVPAHFEADAYAGLRRMVNRGTLSRDQLPGAVTHLTGLQAERIPLAPLLRAAVQLFDRVGAHDVFYVIVAQMRGASLLTTDAPLSRAAVSMGIEVLYHDPEGSGVSEP